MIKFKSFPLKKYAASLLMVVLFPFLLNGCAVKEKPKYKKIERPVLTVEKDDGIQYLGSNGTFRIQANMDANEQPLPVEHVIEGVSFTNASLYEVMLYVLKDTGISFSIVNESPNSAIQVANVTTNNLSGTLPEVIKTLSDYSGFFYSYKNNHLAIYPDRQFLVEIPPVDELMDSITAMINNFGAVKVSLDRPAKVISFRANKLSYDQINNYLSYVSKTRSLIVYDTVIYEVAFSNGSQQGIAWDKLVLSDKSGSLGLTSNASLSGGATQALPIAGGVGFSAIYNGGSASMSVLAAFLETQGTLKTVSQPKISVMAGGKAMWRVGNTTSFVSKVGSTVGSTVTQTTVETNQLLTGLDMLVNGDVYEGTIVTGIKIKLNDLLRFVPYSALGTQLNLPQTANRELETTVRARPGDTIMLAGINIDKESQDSSGLFGNQRNWLPTGNTENSSKSELVIVLKPRLIKFTPPPKKVNNSTNIGNGASATVNEGGV